jgi:hypothetical protein
MEKKLWKKAKKLKEAAEKPATILEEAEGEALGEVAKRLGKWASQLP